MDEKTLIECNERAKSNSRRIETLGLLVKNNYDELKTEIREVRNENKAIYQIATSVEVMAARLGNIEEKVDETNKKVSETARKVNEVENRPAAQIAGNVSAVKMAVYCTVATGAVTTILAVVLHFLGLD